MIVQCFHQRNFLPNGLWKCFANEFAPYYGAAMQYTKLRYLSYLMNANLLLSVFCNIVSRAIILEVLSIGSATNNNAALQVTIVEFQVPSPLVPNRALFCEVSKATC